MKPFKCKQGCGACCIAPSISSAIPKMPKGKKAGQRCFHLDEQFNCLLFNSSQRPQVCLQFKPSEEMCGHGRDHAMLYLTKLEEETSVL